jgi:ribosome-associated protein
MQQDQSHVTTASGVSIPLAEIETSFVRAQGPGGQHVNKTSSAVQLRFDIRRSTALNDAQRRALLGLRDQRITSAGIIVIKAQGHRSREQNRRDAIERLVEFIDAGLRPRKRRVPTRPGKAAVEARLEQKSRRAGVKATRRKPDDAP